MLSSGTHLVIVFLSKVSGASKLGSMSNWQWKLHNTQLPVTVKPPGVVLAGKSRSFLTNLDFSSYLQAVMKTGWMCWDQSLALYSVKCRKCFWTHFLISLWQVEACNTLCACLPGHKLFWSHSEKKSLQIFTSYSVIPAWFIILLYAKQYLDIKLMHHSPWMIYRKTVFLLN